MPVGGDEKLLGNVFGQFLCKVCTSELIKLFNGFKKIIYSNYI